MGCATIGWMAPARSSAHATPAVFASLVVGVFVGVVAGGCDNHNQVSGAAADTATTTTGGQGGDTSAANGGSGGNNAMGGSSATGGSAAAGGHGSLWQPAIGATWQWQLTGLPLDLSFQVDAYDVDLFETTAAEFAQLKADGRIVVCYFSAGSWESFRPDSDAFSESVKGDPLDAPFVDELWIDIRDTSVRTIMTARLDLAVTKGCDAVEPDNVDGYVNNNGLGLTASDQLEFNIWIAQQAHERGLSVGLKNDVDQLDTLEPHFDWALNEECYTYTECGTYSDNFLAAGKAVFHAEYVPPGQLSNVCAVTKPLGLSSLIKNIDLDAFQLTCP